jgi:hypothetical protein
MAVDVGKLLPPKGGALAKTTKSIVKGTTSVGTPQKSQDNISVIRVKVIEIDSLLKGTLAIQKKELDDKKREESKTRREKQESKLEEKPKAEKGDIKSGKLPRMGFLDWVRNFIGKVILGYFAVRMIDYLPKLMPFVKVIGGAADFIINLGGKLLDGLVTFIDWGYKAYDATKGFIKNLFGDKEAKQFDQLAGLLNQFLNLALVVGMASTGRSFGGGRGGRPGRGGGKPNVVNKGFWNERTGRWSRSFTDGTYRTNEAARRYFDRYGRDAAVNRFGQEGVRSLGGKYARSAVTNAARKGIVGTLGKGGTKAVLRAIKPIVSNLPFIGGLIEFGISWALGDPIGKAAFRGIGAGLAGAVGTAIGGPIGLAIGGFVGGELGGALYDMFFGKQKPQPIAEEAQATAGGGVTRGGKVQGTVTRKVKPTQKKRQVTVAPPKLKPGSKVGGDKKIEKIFPKSDKPDTSSPLGYIEDFYNKTSSIPFFGPIFSIATKTLVGDSPSSTDYKNAGVALNGWMSTTFNTGVMRSGGFAGGGEVSAEMFMKGEDLSDVIAKSLEESVSKKMDDAINDLQKQLGLKQISKPAGVPGATDAGPQDLINIQGGDADFWTLVAIASREDGEPQAWADVAQSIYNRLASGAYSGKTIKDLILGQMQYEPTWKFPKPGTTGKPNPEWFAIKDAASAGVAAGQSEDAMKKVAAAILDPTLQKNAREFVQGRTDFRGYSVSGGVQRKSGDNYFGWYNNYTANKIGSVPNFGATATGGAGPGMSGPLGTGRASSVDQFGSIAKQFGLSLTSDYRAGDPGYHGQNRARDYSNDSVGRGTPEQLRFAQHLVQNYGSSLTQLIYTPLGFGIANGKRVGLDYWGEKTNAAHFHHVHVALAKGGRVLKPTFALIAEEGPEFVFDANTTAGLDKLAPQLLDKLNIAKTKPQLSSILQSYASYEQTYSSPEVVIIEKPVPVMDSSFGQSSDGGSLSMMSSDESSYADILYK